jgi:hypothetical protein
MPVKIYHQHDITPPKSGLLTSVTISYKTFKKDVCFKRENIKPVGVAVTL